MLICRNPAELQKFKELPQSLRQLACSVFFIAWHDLGVKTAAMAHIVSANDAFSSASDTTYHGLAEDIITSPHKIANGHITAPDGPGLGIEINRDMLDKYRKKEID